MPARYVCSAQIGVIILMLLSSNHETFCTLSETGNRYFSDHPAFSGALLSGHISL
jgi:hypothetical protein